MMRRWSLCLLIAALLLVPAAPASALSKGGVARALAREMAYAGSASGAVVMDLATGERIYSRRADTQRIPASVEKLYTSVAALSQFGDAGRLDTTALSTRPLSLNGTLDGNLYLRGGGDPALSTARLETLAQALADAGLSRVTGRVIGDDSAFDRKRGVPSAGFRISVDVAPLGALMLNRGRTGYSSPFYQANPPAFAASALARQLRDAGVKVAERGRAGSTPPGALALAARRSPTMTSLLRLQNVPSDNYIAETLLKAVGMTDTRAGTTARGAAVVRRVAREELDLRPRVSDGSGLSRNNRTSPREVTDLLAQKFEDDAFFGSLSVAGVSGTLRNRLRSSSARGRCRGKTGTLSDVSNLAGYCLTGGGDTLAFAILMNRVSPYSAHGWQDRMVNAIARYGR